MTSVFFPAVYWNKVGLQITSKIIINNKQNYINSSPYINYVMRKHELN